jgi:hypothetical protein
MPRSKRYHLAFRVLLDRSHFPLDAAERANVQVTAGTTDNIASEDHIKLGAETTKCLNFAERNFKKVLNFFLLKLRF